MRDAGTPWQPQLGEDVLVGATGDIGEVTGVIGTGADRQFVVAIWSPPGDSASEVHAVHHRLCRLDELAPARMP